MLEPLYFNELRVPEFWEIKAGYSYGRIIDQGRECGRIYYADPKELRFVKMVDWLDRHQTTRVREYYNRYGICFARAIFNERQEPLNKTYFNTKEEEVLTENFVTGAITLKDRKKLSVFASKRDFIIYFLEKEGLIEERLLYNSLSTPFLVSEELGRRYPSDRDRDVLFWHEPVKEELPGNMQIILSGKATRTGKIYVQETDAYQAMKKMIPGVEAIQPLGYIYSFKRETKYRKTALICTNSDQIEHLEMIVKELSEVQFFIVSRTEMSEKLTRLESASNVELYPGATKQEVAELFLICDLYLDINYKEEIFSAVESAFLHHQLIMAFYETVHRKRYVARENCYEKNQAKEMIGKLKTVLSNTDVWKELLERQCEHAMAETVESFQEKIQEI